MTITQNQRKWIIWISAIALVVYYTPSVANMAMQSAYQRQAAQRAPAFIKALPTPALPAPAPFHYLLGEYSGRAVIAARGICALKFELRDKREKPGQFSGYSTLTCTPLWTTQRRWGPNMATMLSPNPTSAILTGAAETGGIRFSVDDTISGAFAPTAFTVRPFGNNQIAIQWQDSCRGGMMLLSKSGR
jgi:hypothetical protein